MTYGPRALLILAALACITPPALGWNKGGHMATGAIAYRVLKKDSPGTIPKVVAILKQNPYYQERWKDRLDDLEDENQDEYLFMLACQWADEAISDERFYPEGGHHRLFHFINTPFKPDGEPDSVQTSPPAEFNIVRAYPEMCKDVKTETDAEDRAAALCWVMHLIGDAHQPLHAASLYTRDFQFTNGQLIGDRGGTRFYVRRVGSKEGTGVSLHTIWDGLVTNESRYRGNRNAVTVLMANPEHAADKFSDELPILDMEKWTRESYKLATTMAYFWNGELLKGGTRKTNAGEVPAAYFTAVEPIAKRRAVLAGYRMAAILKDLVGN